MEKITSITFFTNASSQNKPAFSINHPKKNGVFSSTIINLHSIDNMCGKNIRFTHYGKDDKSILSRRASMVKDLIDGDLCGRYYTGKKQTPEGCIIVDAIETEYQVVAIITECFAANKHNNQRYFVSFTESDSRVNGSAYSTKTIATKAQDIKGTKLQNGNETSAIDLASQIITLQKKLADMHCYKASLRVAESAVSFCSEVYTKAYNDYAISEVKKMNAIDNGRYIAK